MNPRRHVITATRTFSGLTSSISPLLEPVVACKRADNVDNLMGRSQLKKSRSRSFGFGLFTGEPEFVDPAPGYGGCRTSGVALFLSSFLFKSYLSRRARGCGRWSINSTTAHRHLAHSVFLWLLALEVPEVRHGIPVLHITRRGCSRRARDVYPIQAARHSIRRARRPRKMTGNLSTRDTLVPLPSSFS